MTRRKDPQPEAELPQDAPLPVEPFVAEPPEATVAVDPPPSETPLAPHPQVIQRRGSVLAPLAGGALAAIGGFALSHFDVFGLRSATVPVDLAPLTAQVADLQSRSSDFDQVAASLAALTDRVAQLEAAPPPAAPDLSGLQDLDQRLSAIEAMPADGAASTAALTAKLTDLERRIADLPQGVAPDLQQQLDAALARLDAAEAAANARAAEAAASKAAADKALALDALSTRLTQGQPFGPELQAVQDATLATALSSFAETGVPTLAQLQAAFPDAAREALRLAREIGPDDGWGDRLVDFLASQTGARPLTPLEGDTPDAVLSRADFALSEGRIADAVAELETLDPSIRPALDPWLAQARTHLSATAALAAARGE